MKVRPACGGLYEAMQEVEEVNNMHELVCWLNRHDKWVTEDDKVTIEKYGHGIDERIGWNTHMILVNGKPSGYSDGTI